MPLQTNWDHMNVALPDLAYQNLTTAGQGKGSTEWAAHSSTPLGVVLWDEFDELVAAEGQKARNRVTQDIDFPGRLQIVCEDLQAISREEDVTNRFQSILDVFCRKAWNLSGGIIFTQQNLQIIGKPDLVAQERNDEVLGVGPIAEYSSPPSNGRALLRRNMTSMIVSLYRMPFETKPAWKFRFLTSTQVFIDEWEIPEDFDAEKMQAQVPLPKTWSSEKKKVFHLVRQFYGQMVTDKRRYGVIHFYERFFFCKRSLDGFLHISRVFEKAETSPSVFQAIKTMVGFQDHLLDQVLLHPQSATKDPRTNKSKKAKLNPKSPTFPPLYSERKDGSGGAMGGPEAGETNLAASLHPFDCDVFDHTDSLLLLVTKTDPNIIVKLQIDPKMKHVADDMANEAEIYKALEGKPAVKEVIPRFHGHSNHLGVAMTCIERELDDFEDIGLENLSVVLKHSAVRAVEVLSEAGVLHNDIELRNIVQSKRDPNCAKIIDFGRASFSCDRKLLSEQVAWTKTLLKIDN